MKFCPFSSGISFAPNRRRSLSMAFVFSDKPLFASTWWCSKTCIFSSFSSSSRKKEKGYIVSVKLCSREEETNKRWIRNPTKFENALLVVSARRINNNKSGIKKVTAHKCSPRRSNARTRLPFFFVLHACPDVCARAFCLSFCLSRPCLSET